VNFGPSPFGPDPDAGRAGAPGPARTLADLGPGDTAQVHAIPRALRGFFAGFGVHEGAPVTCESCARYVVVRTPEGSIPFERQLLSAVRVAPAAD
jgi:hypothetical protein